MAVVLAVTIAACGNQQAPAEAALKTSQTAFDAVRVEAQKYVPAQAKSVQDGLMAAQDAIAKKDYAGALAQAQGLTPKIAELTSAISAKKAELTAAWGATSRKRSSAVAMRRISSAGPERTGSGSRRKFAIAWSISPRRRSVVITIARANAASRGSRRALLKLASSASVSVFSLKKTACTAASAALRAPRP